MPNGLPPFDERDWTAWRARTTERQDAIISKLDRVLRWTESHEQDEFSFHGRIEGFLATSIEQRIDVLRRLAIVEQQHVDFKKELDQVRFRIWLTVGGAWIGLPILGWLAAELYKHIVNHAEVVKSVLGGMVP